MDVSDVPGTHLSIVDALGGLKHARHIRVASDYEEPENPEGESRRGWSFIHVTPKRALTIESIGDSCAILDKGLRIENFNQPTVHVRLKRLILGAISVAGFVNLLLEECEIDGDLVPRHARPAAAMDVSEEVTVTMTDCWVTNAQIGLRIKFPASGTVGATFENNRVGMALLNNPEIRASSSTFRNNGWADVMGQFQYKDEPILIKPELPKVEKVEIAIHGPWGCLGYKQWPLPEEQKVFPRKKKKASITVNVSPKMVCCDQVAGAFRRREAPAQGSIWARAVLGIGAGEIKAEHLRRAYRKRAREVHPDKTSEEDSVPFLRLSAAYQVISDEIRYKKYTYTH